MKQNVSPNPLWVRLVLFFALFVLAILSGIQIYNVAGNGALLGHFDKIWMVIFVAYLLISIFFLGCICGLLFFSEKLNGIVQLILRLRNRLGWLRWLLALAIVGLVAYLLCYSDYGNDFSSVAIRLYFFSIAILLMGVIITDEHNKLLSWLGLLQSTVIFGAVFVIASQLVSVTDYPFSLTWSEGNRFWDYSVLFGRRLYISPADQAIDPLIDLGRQSLWGLPFLFADITISQARLWSVIVWTIPYALFGWILFRIPGGNRRVWFFMGLWVLIFLQQGPIYTPLVLAAILVVLARRRPLWLGLPLVFFAGVYAEMSRYTWMFAPAIWAMMITIMDHPPEKLLGSFRNWSIMIAYGVAGILGGVGVAGWEQFEDIYNQILAANLTSQLDTANATANTGALGGISTQPLIWSRLLPSSTYPEGIVLGLLFAVGPLALFLLYLVISKRWKLNRWQLLGMAIPLMLFLIVGLIVSVKIGGGSNLHNLDMLLISFVLIAAFAWDGVGMDTVTHIDRESSWLQIAVFLAVAIPAFYPVVDASPLNLPPREDIETTLALIQKESTSAAAQGKEVLFMDQRQLLTFGFIENVPLVADYEKKRVMNEAMSADEDYFADFYHDLANHRFGLIVTEPLRVQLAPTDDAWSEENDVWVERVSRPMLCYYEPVSIFKKTAVWLLVPRSEPKDCSYP